MSILNHPDPNHQVLSLATHEMRACIPQRDIILDTVLDTSQEGKRLQYKGRENHVLTRKETKTETHPRINRIIRTKQLGHFLPFAIQTSSQRLLQFSFHR